MSSVPPDDNTNPSEQHMDADADVGVKAYVSGANNSTAKVDVLAVNALKFDSISINDKYQLETEQVFLSGTQALVRLCLMQAALDKRAGLNTAGYISGYRGSPLGAVDLQFSTAETYLKAANIIFEPGLNEDLAATAVWGTQQAEMRGEGKYDGVFGMWYGKGPGVDRTGDAFRHANLAGTSLHGGVLVLMGDDHTCESSTAAHQSEFAMMDALIPVLNPCNVQEMIELGLHGYAMSRFAGVWCGLKCVKDNVESTASISSSLDSFTSVIPEEFQMPNAGVNIRANDNRHDQEFRMHRFKQEAAKAYVRANALDRIIYAGGNNAKLGVISTGKSYMDTLQALAELGVDEAVAEQLGLRLYKVAMPWPLEPEGVREFAKGLDLIIVVEEKRALMEPQVKDALYAEVNAPRVLGKFDEDRAILLQPEAALNPMVIAQVIGSRLAKMTRNNGLQTKVDDVTELLNRERDVLSVKRAPYFCAGCPHNSSTVVPEGSRAYAGIGCHWMVQIMERKTEGSTQMGGEGANWIGESHFSKRKHVFQNIGDGTFNHSGILSIRAAIAADTNITFKLLYNDAVAMTGGQAHEGGLSPYDIAHEVSAAGAKKVVVVSDKPDALKPSKMPANVPIEHRDQLMQVQQDMAAIDGTTVLIYEQTCAAEKRRRRKRGTMIDPPKRAFINTEVCEGCGDCGVQSNCVAVLAEDTPLGRKRRIDQSACNKDFSCINGFCPSFVTLQGAQLRKPAASEMPLPDVPEPARLTSLEQPFAIALTGVGGTGVVTIGALLGMAAHLQGSGCGIIDMAGLAQKGGAVVSHIKLAATPAAIKAIRIADGGADLLLGCDELVSTEDQILKILNPDSSHLVVNTVERLTGDFTRNPDFKLPASLMRRKLDGAVAHGHAHFVDASRIATALLGDSIGSNLFMLGVAYQLGVIPLQSQAILKAVELNGVAVDFNKRAFQWGRAWVHDAGNVESCVASAGDAQAIAGSQDHEGLQDDQEVSSQTAAQSLDKLVEHRSQLLTRYQSSAYAKRYRGLVKLVRQQDQRESLELAHAVARGAYKLMAYKDEYEVARLYSDGEFQKKLVSSFTGDYTVTLHLAPPLLSKRDAVSGKVKKREFGPWVFKALKPLAKLKFLRGGMFDVFGYTAERRMERQLIADYEALCKQHCAVATTGTHGYDTLLELLRLPEQIRGYGHVKLANADAAKHREKELLDVLYEAPVEVLDVA